MKRSFFAIALLTLAFGSANPLHAQKSAPKSVPAASEPDLSTLTVGKMLEQMQTTTTAANGDTPQPIQIVVQFLELQPNQVQEFAQLLQARQAAVVPLLQGIQQRVHRLEALLNSGGSTAEVGMLVIQIHGLQQQVAHAQQDFLSKFANLLDPEQQQRMEALRIATQVQPVLPAFQQLYLF